MPLFRDDEIPAFERFGNFMQGLATPSRGAGEVMVWRTKVAPGGGPPGRSRQEWDIETKRLYDDGLRPWATEVFDEAVACGALAASSRPLVQSPPPTQLHKLGDLFRGAADTLEAL